MVYRPPTLVRADFEFGFSRNVTRPDVLRGCRGDSVVGDFDFSTGLQIESPENFNIDTNDT